MLVTVTLHAVVDDHFQVPGFRLGETRRATSNASFPAGKGISTVTAMAGLGEAAHSAAVVLCGDDTRGAYMDLLGELGVKAKVHSGRFRTRRHVTISDQRVAEVTHVQVQGVLHPPELFDLGGELVRDIVGLAGPGALVALSGSLPKGAPPAFYGTLIEQVRIAGGRTLLDTSGAPLHAGLLAAPWAVKANRGEAESIVGRKLPDIASQLAAANEIRADHSVGWVILSDGAAGALLVGEHGAFHASLALPAEMVIETDQGCGDSMNAGFMAAVRKGLAPAEIAKMMLLAASANLSTPRPGELSPASISNLASAVKVERV